MRRFLASTIAILMIVQSTAALAAPTTWGRLKRHYVQDPPLTLGPGVTSQEATLALDAIAAGSGVAPARAHVFRIPENNRPGPYVVLGQSETGVGSVHLVSTTGRLLSGCVLDLNRGEARSATSGALLWRASTANPRQELEELLPEGFGDGLRRAIESACKSFAFSIYWKCATATLANPVGEIGCMALLILMYLACQGDLRVAVPGDSDCRSAAEGSRVGGGGLGSFCD